MTSTLRCISRSNLSALYGPEAIARSPRAARFATEGEVRVVIGLGPLTRAVAEIERLPDAARTPGVAASYDEITELISPNVGPETIARRIRGSIWKMEDRSDTGCRLTAPEKEAPTKLGEILTIKEGDTWALGVVRRMQRRQHSHRSGRGRRRRLGRCGRRRRGRRARDG